LLFICGGAQAAGYDDFSQGVSAGMRGDSDLAITFMTRALDEGGLTPHQQALAHYDRGEAYLVKNRCHDALDDFNAALALDAKYARARRLDGAANACLGNTDAALADYTQSLADLPGADGYRGRGHLYWDLGRFTEAADDFRHVLTFAPSDAYGLLWLEISAARAKTDNAEEFAMAAKKATDDWPRPLLDFYVNGAARDAVMKAAGEGTEADRRNQQCEASFYLAEWDLAKGRTADARPLLREASDNCPKNFVEYGAANIELARLK
jgi:lipoprotein NlpI